MLSTESVLLLLILQQNTFSSCQTEIFTKTCGELWREGGKVSFEIIKFELMFLHKNCTDYLHDLDMTSLYPTEMVFNDYPVGNCWEHDEVKIEDFRNLLNYGDETLPLATVECDVDFITPQDEERIFPILSSRNSAEGNLFYTFENNQYFIKNSVLLLDAQKYNHSYITKFYNLFIWNRKEAILS